MVVFHMLRPVAHVAASYDKRARNPKDEWDPLRNLVNCVHELNVMHNFLLDWHRMAPVDRPHKLIYVNYSKVFSDFEYAMNLFREIGVLETGALRSQASRRKETAGFCCHPRSARARTRL